MMYQNNLYCINYNDNDILYIIDLIDTINTNLRGIMNFFAIQEFSQKKIVNIWNNLDAYKLYLRQYVDEYQDWMVADTFNNNINIISYNLLISGPHKNGSLAFYKKIIIHEFVHSCQQEINPIANNVKWFWEALATNLADQDYTVVSIPYSKEDIMYNYSKIRDAYSVSYTIGRYMLKNLPSLQIIEYIKNPNILIDDTDMILEKTKLWLR